MASSCWFEISAGLVRALLPTAIGRQCDRLDCPRGGRPRGSCGRAGWPDALAVPAPMALGRHTSAAETTSPATLAVDILESSAALRRPHSRKRKRPGISPRP